ncbi:MAG: NIPSNAP family protein [Burkholderiales bacterium]|nr:NIPSNAP family protein [Burkholderiales bacterium]
MIVELRLYNTVTGRTREFVDAYKAEGLPIQQPVQGNLLGFYVHEFGPMEQVMMLWGYADLADRERRRSELDAMPAWRDFLRKVAPMVRAHESRLLVPA